MRTGEKRQDDGMKTTELTRSTLPKSEVDIQAILKSIVKLNLFEGPPLPRRVLNTKIPAN